MSGVVSDYLHDLQRTRLGGRATEHSYRPDLQEFIQSYGVRATNDPKGGNYGAPDFIVDRGGVPVGYIECKSIGTNLDTAEKSEQLRRYRDALHNLILTDYLEFRWYVGGEPRAQARLGRFDNQEVFTADPDGADCLGALLDGFFATDDAVMSDTADLAQRMAHKTRLLRKTIQHILDNDTSTAFHNLLLSYRKVLIGDLGKEQFADLQAQTAVYGMFAARCLHKGLPDQFNRQTATWVETTPFLQEVFRLVAGRDADKRIVWIVNDLARLLARANMGAILADFGRRTSKEDPVVHFYEDFLTAYDPELRVQRGVYYTPSPVVSYIVRSIDWLLRDKFRLRNGLADTATTEIAGGETRTSPRVLILDPAAGTGTFLREVISQIRNDIKKQGLEGAWPQYVKEHLLPRLFGFELLMAPYAICHLKLALEIGGQQGGFKLPDGERINVFLTNSLEKPHETSHALFAPVIAHEAQEADAIKRDRPVMVMLGNPPYSGHSANKGKWIRDLVGDYKQDIPELQKPGQAKWLSDDYVKFIRFAQWRIEQTGEGVLGFVTNHSYLDNTTFRGMRQSLMKVFDEIWLLDLHGNANKQERAPDGGRDANVFDIKQGVAIGLFLKSANSGDAPARVFHADLWGEREAGPGGGKYGWLSSKDISSTVWTELSPQPPGYLFVPFDEEMAAEYYAAWSVAEIFSPNGDPAPGIVTTHDQFAISWTPTEAESKVERLLSTESEGEARSIWRLCSQKQWQYERAKTNLADGAWRDHIEAIQYRPFDLRTTVFDRNVAVHRRERVMRHMLAGPNLGLSTTRRTEIARGWEHVFVSKHLIQHHTVSIKEVNYLFPLYLYPSKDGGMEITLARRTPNLAPGFVEEMADTTGLCFVPDGPTNLNNTFGPEDMLHYIYAVLHSPEYRRRYADFLKHDYPRVPLPTSRKLFIDLAGLGKRLTALHLMEDGNLVNTDNFTYPIQGHHRVEHVQYTDPTGNTQGRVWINGKQYFEGVSPEVWSFTIGGYRPAKKWLEDRKELALSFNDIRWYQQMCAVLAETPRIMRRIDKTISTQGGWPLGITDRECD